MLPTLADVAFLIIFAHFIILVILLLAVTAATVKGLMVLNQKLNEVMPSVQYQARRLSSGADKVSDRIAEPFVRIETTQAKFKAQRDFILSSLRRSNHGDR